MKKILCLLSILSLTSCYEDYVNDFDYSAVYFAKQYNVRTVVVGEGLSFKVGAVLGGVIDNDKKRIVNFEMDPSLVSESSLNSLKKSSDTHVKNAVNGVDEIFQIPENYYKLSNNEEIIINKGAHTGDVTFTVDSVSFLSEVDNVKANYVIPFRISSCHEVDTVLKSKNFALIGVRYDNILFGHYWSGGKSVKKDAAGNIIETKTYYTQIPQDELLVRTLTTVSPHELIVDKLGSGVDGKMKLWLDPNGTGKVVVSNVDGNEFKVEQDGDCVFNKAKLLQDRKIYLKYKITDLSNNTVIHCEDTLTFRNRIRDGVNEWQDTNPEHYK